MLHVTRKELGKAFRHLRAESRRLKPSDMAALLLAFYAAEAGLKSDVLKLHGGKDTRDLPEELLNHDLRRLVKALGWDAAKVAPEDLNFQYCFQTREPCRGDSIRVPELHQAFRYGARLCEDDLDRARRLLQAICDAIDED